MRSLVFKRRKHFTKNLNTFLGVWAKDLNEQVNKQEDFEEKYSRWIDFAWTQRLVPQFKLIKGFQKKREADLPLNRKRQERLMRGQFFLDSLHGCRHCIWVRSPGLCHVGATAAALAAQRIGTHLDQIDRAYAARKVIGNGDNK